MSDSKESGEAELPDADLKIILLGDSAVGKSKLLERYLMNDFNPRQLSTYALTLYRQVVYLNKSTDDIVLNVEDQKKDSKDESSSSYASYSIDYWDTAGQEVFSALHPSYYYATSCCILCFDVTRKITYTHLTDWYNEYNSYCSRNNMNNDSTVCPPCILVANKIDVDYNVTKKEFKFASRHNLPFFFVSAADGTNVVKVFHQAIKEALRYKESGNDVLSDILSMLKTSTIPSQISSGDTDAAADSKRQGGMKSTAVAVAERK